MKPTPFLKAFSILLVLVFLIIGAIYIAGPSSLSAGFSTSYQDYPDPRPSPKQDPKDVVEVPGLIEAFDISKDRSVIAIAASKKLLLYDLQTLEEIHKLIIKEDLPQVQFSPDGSKLAVSGIVEKYFESDSLSITIWDTQSWKIIHAYESGKLGWSPSVTLAWAPDSKHFAFSNPENGMSVVNVEDGEIVASLNDLVGFPFSFSWSPDGSRLISTGDFGYGLRRWWVTAGKSVRLFDTRPQPASQVKWSPNGKQIASGHFGGTVCIWNTRNNQCEGFIRAHFTSVDGLDWSPDSRQIATASGAVRIWDASTGELSSSFGFYDGIIYKGLQWFDLQNIATLETSYTQQLPSMIRFWDVSSGDTKLAFRGWDNVQSPNNGGVALHLDDVQIGAGRTVFQVSLLFDRPETSLASDWNITATDSQGRFYPLTNITPEDMDSGQTRVYQTIPLPEGERIILELKAFPPNQGLPIFQDFSAAPGLFTFHPESLQVGESISLDEMVDVNEYTIHLTSAQKISDTELVFEFDSEQIYTGVIIYSQTANGSIISPPKDGKISASLSFSEIPNGPIQIQITRLYYNAYSVWLLDFHVAKSMFIDLPPATPVSVPTAQPEAQFASQDALFLEVQALSKKFDDSVLQGAGWVHIVREIATKNMQEGQTYPPPHYQEDQWLEVDSNGWVTRSLTTHLDKDKYILQQSASVGAHNMNLTTGEAMESPTYRLSFDWILLDLDYALNHGETALREEITCGDGSPCLLITLMNESIARRIWINTRTGQQVKIQTSQQMPDGTETILFTQTTLSIEWMSIPPQDVLDLFSRVLFSAP
ncbi:MAG: hypothetical protein HYZ21_07165 [Chloroflexi bacterium]|nr:hypothetical protein [Chloroflexota bacterium]